jgi:HEAT repeat protein
MSIDQESIVTRLIESLDDPELTVRIHAGLQLAGMGVEARPSLPALLGLQQSDNVHDRRLAAMVLGSLADDLTEAEPALRNALQDKDEAVRRLGADALKKIAPARGRLHAA